MRTPRTFTLVAGTTVASNSLGTMAVRFLMLCCRRNSRIDALRFTPQILFLLLSACRWLPSGKRPSPVVTAESADNPNGRAGRGAPVLDPRDAGYFLQNRASKPSKGKTTAAAQPHKTKSLPGRSRPPSGRRPLNTCPSGPGRQASGNSARRVTLQSSSSRRTTGGCCTVMYKEYSDPCARNIESFDGIQGPHPSLLHVLAIA